MVEPLACVVRGLAVAPVGPGRSVVVIGTGPIALMFVVLASRRGARVSVVGRRPERLDHAASLGAARTFSTGEGDVCGRVREETAGGADLVVEAAGQLETAELAVQLVAKGGTVNLFAGCAAGTMVPLDVQRVHYEEINLTSTFHHTPEAIRAALQAIADGTIDPEALIGGEAPLERVPEILAGMGQGTGLKTAILPGS
jgi:L-iditol 2-dehydrogenase